METGHDLFPGEGGRLARRLGHLAQDIRQLLGAAFVEWMRLVTARPVSADVLGKMPGTAGETPALPGNPEPRRSVRDP